MYYLTIFIIFSILGYVFEITVRLIHHYSLKNILLGPWMPIYGFGMLIVEFINEFLNQFKISGKKKVVLCYILSVITLTILEEIGGLLVQAFFHTSYWNYESIPLHIGPYVNLLVSFIWGFGAIFIEYILIPLLNPYIKKIPQWVSYFLFILILIDHFQVFLTYLLHLQ